jgi:small neutral amino acid transporter SnatA (MarC family)
LVGYWAILAGAVTWWLLLTYFVNKVRTQFNLRGIWVLNRVIGVIVMVMSVGGLVMAAMGKSLY